MFVYIPGSENWQCFSRAGNSCSNVSRSGYIDFSQGHVTKNEPMAVPLWFSGSLEIKRSLIRKYNYDL